MSMMSNRKARDGVGSLNSSMSELELSSSQTKNKLKDIYSFLEQADSEVADVPSSPSPPMNHSIRTAPPPPASTVRVVEESPSTTSMISVYHDIRSKMNNMRTELDVKDKLVNELKAMLDDERSQKKEQYTKTVESAKRTIAKQKEHYEVTIKRQLDTLEQVCIALDRDDV